MKTRLVKLIALGFLLAVTNFAHAVLLSDVDWSPDSIDFGSIVVGTSSTLSSDLVITCEDFVSCDFVLLFDSGGSLDFFSSPTSGTVPGLAVSVVEIDLTFAPSVIGTQSDILVATVTDSSGNAVAKGLSLTGIGVVPIPAAAWLFGSGLLGLIGLSRRKKTA